jgi:benzoyl-CoA reductase/2-hydroxyglutaryl-CoA dehydratase subunit BcrC/BadD/HgdB
MSKLRDFLNYYNDPHRAALEWKSSHGGSVVGYLGLDVPEELIIAAGMLPVRIGADPEGSNKKAELYSEGNSGPVLSSLVARLLDGTYEYIDYLVICSRPNYYAEIFGFFRELNKNQPHLLNKQLALVDLHHTDRGSTVKFNYESVTGFRRTLEEWSGNKITDDMIGEAIHLVNLNRKLLYKIFSLRTAGKPRLSGTETLAIIGSGMVMPKQQHNEMLESLLRKNVSLPAKDGLRLIYSGSETDYLLPYELVESTGAIIVADDQDRGSRCVEVLVDEQSDPIKAIAARYNHRSPSSSGFATKDRSTYLRKLASEIDIDGVIFFILASDHPAAWEYPILRDTLRSIGIPSLELGPQRFHIENPENINKKVNDFISVLA